MLRAGGDQVDAGGLNAGMPEQVGQLCNIVADAVERTCEQVTQVVREDLCRGDARQPADRLHLRPYLLSG